MSGSNRGSETRHLGAFGIVAAILLCSVIVGIVTYSQGLQDERRNYSSHDHAQSAQDRAERVCADLVGTAVIECVYKEIEASEETGRAEQDLNAQQGMKLWALVMAIVSGVTMIISLAALHYLKGTLDLTREAVEDTGMATDAMLESNKLQRQDLMMRNHPQLFLTIDGKMTGGRSIHEMENLNPPYIPIILNITICNLSESPAIIKRFEIEIQGATMKFTPTDTYLLRNKGENFFPLLEYQDPVQPVAYMEFKDIASVNRFVMEPPAIICAVLYDDRLGISHEMGFAVRPQTLTGVSQNYLTWGGDKYNYDREIKIESV